MSDYHDGYTKGQERGRLIERAALIEKVEGMKAETNVRDVYAYYRNEALDQLLSYLREPEQVVEVMEHYSNGELVEMKANGKTIYPPDASQGCCDVCISYEDTHIGESEECGNEDCPCHSPQGDKAEGSI